MTREEAIHFAECLKYHWTIKLDDIEDFYDMAIEALSADAVEVVRCKDCKFYTDAGTMPNKSCCGFCTKLGAVSYYGVDATDFCSFAERRER